MLVRGSQYVIGAPTRLRPPLAMGGGLMLRAVLRKAVLAAVQSEVGPVVQVADPPLGAVVLARRLLPGAARAS